MGKKSPPPPPDYTALATAQANQQNELLGQQTWANRADQYNPWGSQTWSAQAATDPATGKPITQWAQTTQLDPRLQSALDSQIDITQQQSQMAQGLLGRSQQEFGQQMNWGALPAWASAPQQRQQLPQYTGAYGQGPQQNTWDLSRDATPQLQTGLNFGGTQGVNGADVSRQRAEDAIYGSATSRLDPQWAKQQSQFDAKMANQGITQGSDAYKDAYADFNRSKTDAYNQAQMSAVTGGGAEAQRNQGMDLALRQQQVGEIGQQGNFYNQALGQGFGYGQQARQGQMSAEQQAWQQQMGGYNFGLSQQQQAFDQARMAGDQSWSQGMEGAKFQNEQRNQQLTEMMQQRGFSLNEIQALLNGQQVGMPSFGGYSQAGQGQAADLMGAGKAQYSSGLQQFNAQQAAQQQMMKGVGSMAGAFFGFG